jgi:hypothetical protein
MGGVVQFEDAVYTLTRPIPVVSGVSYIGQMPQYAITGNIPDQNQLLNGGTILVGDGTFPCFAANNTAQASATTAIVGDTYNIARGTNSFAANAVTSANFKQIGFKNFTRPFDIGAVNNIGLAFASVEDIYIENCTDFANFENFQHCRFRRIYSKNQLATPGGIRFACSVPTATLLPGNSDIGDVYSINSALTARGVVFEAVNGSQMNEVVTVGRIQSNRYGGATVSITGAFTNGSALIVVSDPTQFSYMQLGMPVIFNASVPNWYAGNAMYYVATRDAVAKTISLSSTPLSGGGAQVSSVTGNYVMTCGGFAGLEVHADNTSLFSNCDFSNLDLECSNNILSLSMRRLRSCTILISEMFASSTNSGVVGRDCTFNLKARSVSALTTDFDTNVTAQVENLLGGERQLTVGETLASSRGDCTLYVNSATAVTITVPTNLYLGFNCRIIQAGAGKVTLAASGTTLNSLGGLLSTSGQFAAIYLEQISKGVFTVSGNLAA